MIILLFRYVFKEESIAGLWNSAKKIMPELSNTDLSPRALTKHNLMVNLFANVLELRLIIGGNFFRLKFQSK